MVKIPGLDDLKKMGSDLLDSAKTVDLSGMVDKFKTGIESVGKSEPSHASDNVLSNMFHEMSVTLTELNAANAATAAAIKKMQNQLGAAIAKMDKTTYQPKNEEDKQK